MTFKEWLGLSAIALNAFNVTLYMRSITSGKTRPHPFSWLLWSVSMAVVAVAQYSDEAGTGAWTTGVAAAFCLFVGILALFYGEKRITRTDWAAFVGALLSVPLWVVTRQPLASILLLTAIDASGYYPTARKSWHDPYRESIYRPFGAALFFFMSILALEHYSLTTTFYPGVMIAAELALVTMLVWRRRISRSLP